MFGMPPFAGSSALRTLSTAGGHHPVPLSTCSPAAVAAYASQVDFTVDRMICCFVAVFCWRNTGSSMYDTSVWVTVNPRHYAVSTQVDWVINPALGCHYLPPGWQLPSQLQSISASTKLYCLITAADVYESLHEHGSWSNELCIVRLTPWLLHYHPRLLLIWHCSLDSFSWSDGLVSDTGNLLRSDL